MLGDIFLRRIYAFSGTGPGKSDPFKLHAAEIECL